MHQLKIFKFTNFMVILIIHPSLVMQLDASSDQSSVFDTYSRHTLISLVNILRVNSDFLLNTHDICGHAS